MAKQPKRPFQPTDIETDMTGYCVKCRKKNQPINEPTLDATFIAKQGKWKPMVQGTHKKCGTKMTVFVGQDFVDEVFA